MSRNTVFRRDFSEEFSDLTHLHGFKELSLSSSKIEKICWFLIILGAFTFTSFLIYKSVQDSLDDKKRTFIEYKKYGNITFSVLYCPTEWIDQEKVEKANVSDDHLIYLLSYLRKSGISNVVEKEFLNRYYTNVAKDQFCSNIYKNELVVPALIFLAPFLEDKCLDYNGIPYYFGKSSRRLINYYKKIMKVVDTSNAELMKIIFEACLNNNYDKVWQIVYNNFFLSLSIKLELERYFEHYGIKSKIAKCGTSQNGILLSFHDIDNLYNQSHTSCSISYNIEINDLKIVNETHMCSMYNDAIIYYMFHSDAVHNYFFEESTLPATFEKRYSKEILQIISTEKNYSNYLTKNDQSATYDTFKKYINTQFGISSFLQNVHLMELRQRAEEEFKKKEKENFYLFMKNRTVFDILKTISYDENKFLLGMSVDRHMVISPMNGSIDVEKVINALGVCYLFKINANMKPVVHCPTNINNLNKRRIQTEKLYLNIVELDAGEKLHVRPGKGVLVLGPEANNLIPSQNSFEIKIDYDAANNFNSFEISKLAYQKRHFGECQKNVKNQYNITHTHSNCLSNCFNIYVQPKYIDGILNRKANCKYIAESMEASNVSEQCSFFTAASLDKGVVRNEDLDKCKARCLEDCSFITFDIKSTQITCSESSYDCLSTSDGSKDEKSKFKKFSLVDSYLNLFSNGSRASPIWMKPSTFSKIEPTVYDMTIGFPLTERRPIARIEIQINADVTTSGTKKSLEWHSYLGIIGGQINLIISGSVLTVFQTTWWFWQSCYRKRKYPFPSRLSR